MGNKKQVQIELDLNKLLHGTDELQQLTNLAEGQEVSIKLIIPRPPPPPPENVELDLVREGITLTLKC